MPLSLTIGCNQNQPPNATHIISNRNYYIEGEQIHIFCDFNGDVNINHYDVEWNKGDHEDITNFFTAGKKYKSYRQSNCPTGSSCCSYHDFLTVTDTSKNDSGVYTCLAWPVAVGTPRGNNLSVYVCKFSFFTCVFLLFIRSGLIIGGRSPNKHVAPFPSEYIPSVSVCLLSCVCRGSTTATTLGATPECWS